MDLLKWALRIHVIGSLSNNDSNNSENGKKTIGLDWQNNSSARHHSFLYISLPLWHDYYVKLPNFMFCRGCEHKRTILFFFSWTLIQAFRIQLHKKLPTFWWIEQDGTSTKKFEAAQTQFLSDVFVTVTIVVA